MVIQAHLAGADAVIGIRYDATELMKGVTEVLCYGPQPFAVQGDWRATWIRCRK